MTEDGYGVSYVVVDEDTGKLGCAHGHDGAVCEEDVKIALHIHPFFVLHSELQCAL